MGRCLEETGWIERRAGTDPQLHPLLLHQTEQRHCVPAYVLHSVFFLNTQR